MGPEIYFARRQMDQRRKQRIRRTAADFLEPKTATQRREIASRINSETLRLKRLQEAELHAKGFLEFTKNSFSRKEKPNVLAYGRKAGVGKRINTIFRAVMPSVISRNAFQSALRKGDMETARKSLDSELKRIALQITSAENELRLFNRFLRQKK